MKSRDRKALNAFITSLLIIGQVILKNSPVNPLGPGAFLEGSYLIVAQISSSEKQQSKPDS
jgi:hypothetical protein